MELPREEYWSGLPFPTPGDLPDPGIDSGSLASLPLAGRFLTTVPLGSPNKLQHSTKPECTKSEHLIAIPMNSTASVVTALDL